MSKVAMHDEDLWQQLPMQRNMVGEAAASITTTLYGADEAAPEDADTGDSTPGDEGVLGADGDDTSATDESSDESTDTGDGTPEDEEEADGGFEQRYKDLQAEFTVRTQELSSLKATMAEAQAEVTRTTFVLRDRYEEQEQMSAYLMRVAQTELQQLQQVNVQQLNQQQYANWQQAIQTAGQKAQGVTEAYKQIAAKAKELREGTRAREAAIARAALTLAIDDFDSVYPDIGKFAVDYGVNPQVFKTTTDAGIIRMIHELMTLKSQPDAIKKLAPKKQAVAAKQGKIAKHRTAAPIPKTREQIMYPSSN